MTMNAKRRRTRKKLASLPGVRSVRRPVCPDTGGGEFDVYYVRTGRKTAHPLVVIPGGPGVASIALYRGFRRRAAAAGLDVIMVEHRGVGMSRLDDAGADLPPQALTILQVVDDIVAVLDDAHVGKAVLYGASYGTYLAAGMGVRHPQRVAGMILDSPVLSGDDIHAVRTAIRDVLWDGTDSKTTDLARKVRQLVRDEVLTPAAGQLAAELYGFGGPALLNRQLKLLLQGRHGLWTLQDRLARQLIAHNAPYRNEPDLVGRIGFRELNYGDVPDGKPLDPALAYRELASDPVSFEAEPYDLVAEMPKFTWPTVVVSGGRDLTTPPAIADRIASLIPGALLVRLATAGHSMLDIRERAALQIARAFSEGRIDMLAARAAALDAMPAAPALRFTIAMMGAATAIESVLPRFVPRIVHRFAATS